MKLTITSVAWSANKSGTYQEFTASGIDSGKSIELTVTDFKDINFDLRQGDKIRITIEKV